jgi:hypothetical protein
MKSSKVNFTPTGHEDNPFEIQLDEPMQENTTTNAVLMKPLRAPFDSRGYWLAEG